MHCIGIGNKIYTYKCNNISPLGGLTKNIWNARLGLKDWLWCLQDKCWLNLSAFRGTPFFRAILLADSCRWLIDLTWYLVLKLSGLKNSLLTTQGLGNQGPVTMCDNLIQHRVDAGDSGGNKKKQQSKHESLQKGKSIKVCTQYDVDLP